MHGVPASGRKFRVMLIKLPRSYTFRLGIFIFCCVFLNAAPGLSPAVFSAPLIPDRERSTAENSFSWDANRRLSWDDFQGAVRRGAPGRFAAETSCGIAIETNRVRSYEKVRVKVSNSFDRDRSWVRSGNANPEVLRHEQCHWDICELYTRIMQARFDAADITGANLKSEVQRIYDEVSNAYLARQEQYEQDTRHGTIPGEQQRWEELIARELAAAVAGDVE